MRPVLACVFAAFYAVTLPLAARADGDAPAPKPHYYVPKVPDDMSQVDFYLITAGVGTMLHERFGHTGFRVHDKLAGTDIVYNWGRFSFNEPGFALKFYRGRLTYSMGIRTMEAEVESFLDSNRRLWQEKLNLSDTQKRKLMEKIAWNAIPENRNFAYQYWYKNCATIPRDYLDEVLDGQIRTRFATAPAAVVFRDYVRGNLQHIPFVAPGLDVVMNANIDRPISLWEEMFLPGRLREVLLDMPAVGDDGQPIPGAKLLSDGVVLIDEPEDMSASFPDYAFLASFAWLPLGLAGVGVLARRRRLAFAGLGLAGVGWGLLSGLVGVALVINWLASGHEDTWHNANLLLFSPFDFILMVLGWRIFRARDRVKDRVLFVRSGRLLCLAHAVGLALMIALGLAGIIEQNSWRVLAWFGVPAFAVCLSYAALAFGEPAKTYVLRDEEALGKSQKSTASRRRPARLAGR